MSGVELVDIVCRISSPLQCWLTCNVIWRGLRLRSRRLVSSHTACTVFVTHWHIHTQHQLYVWGPQELGTFEKPQVGKFLHCTQHMRPLIFYSEVTLSLCDVYSCLSVCLSVCSWWPSLSSI